MIKKFRVCDNCKKIEEKGLVVGFDTTKGEEFEYTGEDVKDFCSFECAIKWHEKKVEKLKLRMKKWRKETMSK